MKDLILAEHLHFEYVREEEENVLVLNLSLIHILPVSTMSGRPA